MGGRGASSSNTGTNNPRYKAWDALMTERSDMTKKERARIRELVSQGETIPEAVQKADREFQKEYDKIDNRFNETMRNINQASRSSLSNKKDMIAYIKKQTNIDVSKYVEPKTSKSRTYLGVHLENMSRNDSNAIRTLLQSSYGNNLRIEYNGGYGYAIYYKKKR